MEQFCVLIYSKYSMASNKLLNALQSSPVDLNKVTKLTRLCIDNQDIRKQILHPNKFEITSVPCILVVLQSGEVQRYEGRKAFEWVDELVNFHMPPPPIPQQQVEYKQTNVVKKQKNPKQSSNDKNETSLEDLGFGVSVSDTNESSFIEPIQPKKETNVDVKLDATSKKSGELMSSAMAMQKEREAVEHNNKDNVVRELVTDIRPI